MEETSDRSTLTAVILAFVIMLAVAAGIYLLIPHKLTAITVTKVDVFAPHTEFTPSEGDSVHVVGEPGQAEDDLYVVAHLNMTDKLSQRVFINGWSGTITLADGTSRDATYVAKSQLPRLQQIFPQIASLATTPIGDGDELDPGVNNSGSIVLLFPNTTQDEWNKRRSAELTLNIRDHGPQTVKL